jgi:hypothetical protein
VCIGASGERTNATATIAGAVGEHDQVCVAYEAIEKLMPHGQILVSSNRAAICPESWARKRSPTPSVFCRLRNPLSATFCKRALTARYALANSNRSAPHSDSSGGRVPSCFVLSRMRNRPAAGNLIKVYLLTAQTVGSANFATTVFSNVELPLSSVLGPRRPILPITAAGDAPRCCGRCALCLRGWPGVYPGRRAPAPSTRTGGRPRT